MSEGVTLDGTNIYEFEGFRIDPSKRVLFGPDGVPLPLMPKAFDLLLYLALSPARVIDKDELMSAVWPDTIVEENNLTQNISSIRKTLGERHRENRFIATIPGRGYKFVAAVRRIRISSADHEPDKNVPASPGPASHKGLLWVGGAALLACGALVWLGSMYWRGSSSAAPKVRSVAVLPFKPIAADKRDESLEMGMADTLILKLSDIENLKVSSLASVRRFSSPDQDAIAAGRELGVEAVLDGRLQSSGDRVRANVQLLSVADGRQIWSGQFDDDLKDIFDLQDSIAQRVAGQLSASLGKKGTKRYTESVEAYELYMLGNLHSRRLIKTEVEKGLEYYQKAINADPNFALAYVEIANANRALVLTSDAPAQAYMPNARAAALKAVELDGELSEAWTALASSDFWYDWNWAAAADHFNQAIDRDPKSASARMMFAHFLSNMGRHEEAVREIRRALEIEPASLITNAVEGQILFFAGDVKQAEDVLNRTVELDPRFWLGHLFLTRVYISEGRWDDAIAAGRLAGDLSGGNAEALATTAYCLAMAGRPAEARRILADLQARSESRPVPNHALGLIHLALGERDMAVEDLGRAFHDREALMTFIKVEPKWDLLRDDPRFKELLAQMNLK